MLPIGGLKEKLLAALRAGVKTVFIPKENEKDLAEIPDNVKKGLELIPVAHVDEVISHALVRKPEAIEWEEPAEPPATPARPAGGVAGRGGARCCGIGGGAGTGGGAGAGATMPAVLRAGSLLAARRARTFSTSARRGP